MRRRTIIMRDRSAFAEPKPQFHSPIGVDLCDEWPTLACSETEHCLLRADECLRKGNACAALPPHEEKEPDAEAPNGTLFSTPITNLLVEGHHEPATFPSLFQPNLVRGVWCEVVVHYLDHKPSVAQDSRDSFPPEVAIQEENGFGPVAHAASGSSNRIASLTSRGEHL